jgi:hypothetical protein
VTAEGGEIVAEHPRCWARHQTITDPDHKAAADRMRGDFIHARAAAASAARTAAALAPDNLGVEVEQRRLDTYDRMFTLIQGGAGQEED